MTQHTLNNIKTGNRFWTASVRVLHWLTAASMIGAASLTSQGDALHAALGWLALGVLLILQFVYSRPCAPNPALWLITAAFVLFNLSDLIVPGSNIHTAATLTGLVIAAFYCATVLFELLQRVTSDAVKNDGSCI